MSATLEQVATQQRVAQALVSGRYVQATGTFRRAVMTVGDPVECCFLGACALETGNANILFVKMGEDLGWRYNATAVLDVLDRRGERMDALSLNDESGVTFAQFRDLLLARRFVEPDEALPGQYAWEQRS